MLKMRIDALLFLALLMAAGCAPRTTVNPDGRAPTATLAPIVSQTPRLTATPVPTRTPIPTYTPIPPTVTLTLTPSLTFTPTEEPPILGVVASLDRVNVRTGPGVTYDDFASLAPGTAVEVIGQSSDGRWLNVKLEGGDEGWMSTQLVRLLPTPTPFPTFTPTVDLTAIALGTIYPTAVLGGGTITATPALFSASGASPTPVIPVTLNPNAQALLEPITPLPSTIPRSASMDSTPVLSTFTPTPSPTATRNLVVDESVLPVVDINSINATATALSQIVLLPPSATPSPTLAREAANAPTQSGSILDRVITPVSAGTAIPTAVIGTPVPVQTSASARLQQGVDVLAYCDDRAVGAPPPTTLAAGSTVDIYWVWYADTEANIQAHLNSAVYEVVIDDVPLRNLNQYRQPIRQISGQYAVFWYAPVGPLAAGEHRINYRLTWTSRIFDGLDFYGPGTNRFEEVGTCTFTVYAN